MLDEEAPAVVFQLIRMGLHDQGGVPLAEDATGGDIT
jgi:hypothetical protein